MIEEVKAGYPESNNSACKRIVSLVNGDLAASLAAGESDVVICVSHAFAVDGFCTFLGSNKFYMANYCAIGSAELDLTGKKMKMIHDLYDEQTSGI